ncbi:hypothetical protein LI294_23740 [bacterium 210702-DFI.5.13]|nr:hypothetical protein [bacterium 210702-DFI.5.13]
MEKKGFGFAVGICVIVFVVIIGAVALLGTSTAQRTLKSVSSDFGGGLNRTVTVYDYNGNEIRSWAGKFDVSESENEVYFDDENGKRIIIHGGIVINEEN